MSRSDTYLHNYFTNSVSETWIYNTNIQHLYVCLLPSRVGKENKKLDVSLERMGLHAMWLAEYRPT